METIEFKYCFKDGTDVKEVRVHKSDEDGLHDYEICDMFIDFMRSVGYSEENIYRYFNE